MTTLIAVLLLLGTGRPPGDIYTIEGRVLSKSTFYSGVANGKTMTFVAVSVKPQNGEVAKSYVVCQGSDIYSEQFMPGQDVKATLITGPLCDTVKRFKQIGIWRSARVRITR